MSVKKDDLKGKNFKELFWALATITAIIAAVVIIYQIKQGFSRWRNSSHQTAKLGNPHYLDANGVKVTFGRSWSPQIHNRTGHSMIPKIVEQDVWWRMKVNNTTVIVRPPRSHPLWRPLGELDDIETVQFSLDERTTHRYFASVKVEYQEIK